MTRAIMIRNANGNWKTVATFDDVPEDLVTDMARNIYLLPLMGAYDTKVVDWDGNCSYQASAESPRTLDDF